MPTCSGTSAPRALPFPACGGAGRRARPLRRNALAARALRGASKTSFGCVRDLGKKAVAGRCEKNGVLVSRAAADGAMGSGQSQSELADGKITESAAVASVMKAIMGAGCFALPWAFANGGLALTTGSMFFMALVCLKTLGYMFKARDAALDLDGGKKLSDYENYVDISELTLGGKGSLAVRIIMCLTCFGVCSAYLVFLSSTMVTIASGYSWPAALQNEKTMIYVMSPLMILLAFLRSVSAASLISIFGNVSVVVGMAFVLADALKNPVIMSSLPMAVPTAFSAYVGSVAFLFLVHFALPDIEANMRKRKDFMGAAGKGYAFCVLICLAFGSVGALGYGPQVKSVAIAMLEGGVVAVTVKLLLCANVLATFPLIVRSSFTTIESALGGLTTGPSNLMRTLYVLAAAFCAASIPSFGKLVGLVGGVACTALGMTVPVIMLYSVNRKVTKGSGKPIMTAFDKVFSPLILVLSAIVMALVIITS